MREILFRGKSTDDGTWKYSMSLARHVTEDGVITSYYIGSGCDTVKAETVGQYTGLTDKNGTKIFEGDILESHYDEEYPDDFCYEVVLWYDNGWCIRYKNAEPDHLDEDERLEYSTVIGNIHDTPELLRKEDEGK